MAETAPDPADDVTLAETVGLALHVVLDRLTPGERVAFVLHDSFGFEFPTIAAVPDTTPAAARQLASRVRFKVASPAPEDGLADRKVVDAFMARGEAKVLFDLAVVDGLVQRITFRADPEVLAHVARREREGLRG